MDGWSLHAPKQYVPGTYLTVKEWFPWQQYLHMCFGVEMGSAGTFLNAVVLFTYEFQARTWNPRFQVFLPT